MPYIPTKDRPQYMPMIEIEASFINQKEDYRAPRLAWVMLTLVDTVFGEMSKRRYADHAEIDSIFSCARKEYSRMFSRKCTVTEKEHTPDFWTITDEDVIPALIPTIEDHALHVPSDRMLRGGHLNFSISMLIHRVYGDASKRTPSQHSEVEMVLDYLANKYYDEHTAPYEDLKIGIEGDLDGNGILVASTAEVKY